MTNKGEHDGFYDAFTGRMDGLADRKNGWNIIGRMRRLFRKIGIVEIKIPYQPAVGESRKIGQSFVTGTPHRGALRHLDGLGNQAGNPAGRGIPRCECATKTVERAPFDFVHNGIR